MRRASPRTWTTRTGARSVVAVATAGTALVLVLAGCSPDAPGTAPGTAPDAPATPTQDISTVAPTTTPASAPVLVPDGTAEENLVYFGQVVETVWASSEAVRGGAYVDALTSAGFDRAAMQVTADTTTIGQPAESIQVSVAWRDACLVGQVGPSTGDPVVAVLPLLADGRCLVGETASVDG